MADPIDARILAMASGALGMDDLAAQEFFGQFDFGQAGPSEASMFGTRPKRRVRLPDGRVVLAEEGAFIPEMAQPGPGPGQVVQDPPIGETTLGARPDFPVQGAPPIVTPGSVEEKIVNAFASRLQGEAEPTTPKSRSRSRSRSQRQGQGADDSGFEGFVGPGFGLGVGGFRSAPVGPGTLGTPFNAKAANVGNAVATFINLSRAAEAIQRGPQSGPSQEEVLGRFLLNSAGGRR